MNRDTHRTVIIGSQKFNISDGLAGPLQPKKKPHTTTIFSLWYAVYALECFYRMLANYHITKDR